MENKDKPRICEVLGVEVGESFKVDFPSVKGVFSVDSDGGLRDKDNVRCCEALSYMINNPESIHKIPRWTPEEVELAKAIRVVWPSAYVLEYNSELSDSYILVRCRINELEGMEHIEALRFPSLKRGESVLISDIIGGDENA